MIKRDPWYCKFDMKDPEKFAAVKMQADSYEWALAFAKYDSWTLEVDTETFADKTTAEAMAALKNKSRVNRNVRGVRHATIPLTLDGAWLDDNLLACNETMFVWADYERGWNREQTIENASERILNVRDEILCNAYRLGREFNKFTGTYCYFDGADTKDLFISCEWLRNEEQWSWLKAAVPMVKAYITKQLGIIVDIVMLYANVEFPTILETIRLAEQWVAKRDEKLAKVTDMLESGELVLDERGDVMMPDAPAFKDVPGNGEWDWGWTSNCSNLTRTSAEVDRRLMTCLEGNNILQYCDAISKTWLDVCWATRLGWTMFADEKQDDRNGYGLDPDRYDLNTESMPDELRGITPVANAMSFNTISIENWSEVIRRNVSYEPSIYTKIHK